MPRDIRLAEVKDLVGQEIGVSKWFTVDQTMIDRFAEATEDHQFIHTDPVRAAAETPFGGTIAHGFLSLSLLSAMNFDCLPRVIELGARFITSASEWNLMMAAGAQRVKELRALLP